MSGTERLCMGCMSEMGEEEVCSVCGYDGKTPNPSACLPMKFIINDRYIIGKVISQTGESICYMSWDNVKGISVIVKEYFPIGCAHRNPDKTVSIVSGKEYPYNEGLLEFIEINRSIIKSELPALVNVYDVFEENGTVFSVNQNVSGITLRDFIAKNGGSLKWEQVRPLFLPLIDTIKAMNDMGVVHRGISVDTIIVGRDGKLRLSQYAVKSLRISDSEFSSQIFAGFAAIEQYGVMDMPTSACTDVYGLCATIYTVLVGNVPPEATSRLQNDSMTIPSRLAEELPHHVLVAMANGLQVLPKNRTKNIEDFKNELVYGEMISVPEAPVKKKVSEPKAEPAKPAVKKVTAKKAPPKKAESSSVKYAIISSACTAGVFILIGLILALTIFREQLFKTNAVPKEESSVAAPVVDKLGDVDSSVTTSGKTYPVPNFKGKYYSEVAGNEDYERFKFVIKDKEFSTKYAKGTICSQSISEGTSVVKDTTIELVISLGPQEIKIANLKGLTENAAKLELLKQGFLYTNIEVIEKYDPDSKSGVIIEQEPAYGASVSTDVGVKIYINTYEE